MAADSVSRRGGVIVAVVVMAVVGAAVALSLGRDDVRSTPVEDAAAGRTTTAGTVDPTDSDPLVSGQAARPQGKEAPDSNEGSDGAGSPVTTRETPALNPGTSPETTAATDGGRNAPADPNNEAARRVPRNDLQDGANVNAERGREVR